MVEFKFVIVFTKRLAASHALYKSLLDRDGKLSVTMIPVQKQKDSSGCRLFAIAFATNILEGISSAESEFNVTSTRNHLLECLEKQQLSAFPQNPKRGRGVVSSEGFRIFKI